MAVATRRNVNWDLDRQAIFDCVDRTRTLDDAAEMALAHYGLICTAGCIWSFVKKCRLAGEPTPDLGARSANAQPRVPPTSTKPPEGTRTIKSSDFQSLPPAPPVAAVVSAPPSSQDPFRRNYNGIVKLEPPRRGCVLVVSDVHVPYHDVAKTEVLLRVSKALQPDYTVINGDFWDCYLLRKQVVEQYELDPERFDNNMVYEFGVGRPIVQELERNTKSMHAIIGNHEDRFYRTFRKNIGLRGLLQDPRELMGFSQEAEIYPEKTKLKIGDLQIFHGGPTGGNYIAAKIWRRYKRSMVAGHTHSSDWYCTINNERLDRVVVSGCLIDIKENGYVDEPDWTNGFVVVWYDTDPQGNSVFNIENCIFSGNSVMVGGQLYS